jgi:hypothetical protein
MQLDPISFSISLFVGPLLPIINPPFIAIFMQNVPEGYILIINKHNIDLTLYPGLEIC